MKIAEVMTSPVEFIAAEDTIQEAARKMRDLDVGSLPICDASQDKLTGMITDRDIILRAAADGCDPKTTLVADCMTAGVFYCFEDDDVGVAARLMEEQQIRRLPVLSRDKRLIGIVSLGDLAVETRDDQMVGEVLEKVSEPAA